MTRVDPKDHRESEGDDPKRSRRKWRTELPNMLDELGLDVYEYRLLGHYIRRGMTYEGSTETARVCNMSRRQVLNKRKSLAERGLIYTCHMSKSELIAHKWRIPDDAPDGDYCVVKPLDIWEKNLEYFQTKKTTRGRRAQRELEGELREGFKRKIDESDA